LSGPQNQQLNYIKRFITLHHGSSAEATRGCGGASLGF